MRKRQSKYNFICIFTFWLFCSLCKLHVYKYKLFVSSIRTRTNLNDTEKIHKNDEKKVRTKQPSRRQLKREKAEKEENEKRMTNRVEVMKKGLNYVSKVF